MNKRFLVVLIITFLSVTAVHAQASVDPGNIFYDYATKWEAQGLVKRLPPMRPYPLANIKEILSNVIENGSEQDAELAKIIWEEETGRAWHFTFETDITYKNSSIDDSLSKDDFLLSLLPDAHGEISFFDDFVSFGYRIGADFFALGARDGLRTLYTNRPRDYADDTGHIGPFSMDLDVDSSISVGTTNLFFQGGLNRRGYGPFQSEGSIINDTVLHSPNFSLTYLNDFFSYTQSMFFVSATRSYDGQVHTFGKYFAFHALEFNFFKGIFSLAYVENIVFGDRFEASYLLPVPYLAIQIMYDAADNLQMGFVFNYKPIKDLKFSAEFFVDEAAITGGIASLNPDSRYRFTFNIGGVYAPSESIVKDVHLNYLSIMPFTYSHWQYESATSGLIPVGIINYSDYTHYGMSMGTPVPPNSDRIGFKIHLTPLKDFNISVSSSFVRHGNVVESFTDEEAIQFLLAKKGQYSTDGSIFTHSMFENPDGTSLNVIPTGHHRLNYLTQEHKMYVIQAGVDADYTFFRQKWGSLSVTLGYNFECIINKGVDSNLYPGGQVISNGDGTYTVEGVSSSMTQAQTVAYFKEAWVNSMHTVFNHYITLGLRYTF